MQTSSQHVPHKVAAGQWQQEDHLAWVASWQMQILSGVADVLQMQRAMTSVFDFDMLKSAGWKLVRGVPSRPVV